MNVTIRSAKVEDVEALFAVRTSVVENHQSREKLAELGITANSIASLIQNAAYSCHVATDGDRIIGFSMTDLSEGYVFALFVRPEYESQGIGRGLMELTEAAARAWGVSTLWLSTGDDRALRAYGFYRHLGWRADGVLEDGQIVFRKRLAGDG
ncbi:MAG: GNAT family N-acetyltransferase [Candidatus Competibacteraceae bacterium]|nr:GNAT family N-acetyltransferase [Candidatus Competibacteraceae bacterium]